MNQAAQTMTHTVTCKFDKSVDVRSDTIEVYFGKNCIKDAFGNRFDMNTGRRLTSVRRSVAQKIDLSTLTPIAA